MSVALLLSIKLQQIVCTTCTQVFFCDILCRQLLVATSVHVHCILHIKYVPVHTLYCCTGELYTAAVLDRELTSQYVIPIAAQDGGGRAGYTTVRVTVADMGDNKPHFLLANYRTNVYATAEPRDDVIKVSQRCYIQTKTLRAINTRILE